jgi:2-C-methyl-D-erythritol 4-phosphate cytidylyltransferase
MSNKQDKYVIVVAGGKGKRMQTDTPKQFLLLKGKPVLMHTIETFFSYDASLNMIVVLPEEDIALWKDLCSQHVFEAKHTIVKGGSERFYSVAKGLAVVPDGVLVAIHDGVRPFPSAATIARTCELAAEKGNAIPVIDVYDSIRQIHHDNSNTSVNRAEFKLIQTPQVFQSTRIKFAYNQGFSTAFTDDASVLESLGDSIFLVEGNRENIKITTPQDLFMAEYFLSQQK